MKKTFRIMIAVLLGLIIFIGIYLGYQLVESLFTPIYPIDKQSLTFVVKPGESVRGLAFRLQQMRLIKRPYVFIALAKIMDCERALKVGEYVVMPGATPWRLLRQIVNGDAIKRSVTIVEGWSFQQILTALANDSQLQHTVSGLSNDKIMEMIGHGGEEPEGRFAADTYVFSTATSDADVLRSAYALMSKRLSAAWSQRDLQAFYQYKCPYEALIVASMIEKETAIESEKPIIAGVILRRLQNNMPLQIDPTVIYGLGKSYTGKLTSANMKQVTAYNTYKYRGLPPTPICMPGQGSLHAALHPLVGTALYYVARQDGSHAFSDNLAQQEAAIKTHLLIK